MVSLPTLLIFSCFGAIQKSLEFVSSNDISESNEFLYPDGAVENLRFLKDLNKLLNNE